MKTQPLTPQEQRAALGLARRCLNAFVTNGERIQLAGDDPVMARQHGVFATLYRGRHLRGCIGTMTGTRPLGESIAEMVRSAASRDTRFSPVTREEIGQIRIELSVLGSLEPVDGPAEIEIGTHGILVENDEGRGLLLPQVATERDWDPRTFLEQTCQKAGLAPSAWIDPAAKIHVFTAQIFREEP